MPPPDTRPLRTDPAARAVRARWRALTGGRQTRDRDRPTLLACSGGADSTALVLALAAPGNRVAHVVHDLRDPAETAAERDRVAKLTRDLGMSFHEARAEIREAPGNTESNARRARYRALADLAWDAGCPFVATAHHAGDQLETMLMATARGSSVRGLAGMPPSRPLHGDRAALIRPMLSITREKAEHICTLAGVTWATDPSNADLSRLRAAVRAGPARQLQSLRPHAARHAAELAEHLRQVTDLLDSLAQTVLTAATHEDHQIHWPRETLTALHPAVLTAALRAAFARLHSGRHADRLPARALRQAEQAIRRGRPAEFNWKAATLTIEPDRVTLRRTHP